MPYFLRPHGLQPARLLCPWDSPGKNTGVGCHFLPRERTRISCLAGGFFTTEPPGTPPLFFFKRCQLKALPHFWLTSCLSSSYGKAGLHLGRLTSQGVRGAHWGALAQRREPSPKGRPSASHGQRSLAGCSPWGGKVRNAMRQETMDRWVFSHL